MNIPIDHKPEECRIVTVVSHAAAVAKAEVSRSGIPAAERSLRAKIAAAVAGCPQGVVGKGFTLFRVLPDGRLDLQPGVLLHGPFTGNGEVEPANLPSGQAVRLLLVGGYEGLAEAWQTVFRWCQEQDLKLANTNWQIYGAWDADPAKLETELFALLA